MRNGPVYNAPTEGAPAAAAEPVIPVQGTTLINSGDPAPAPADPNAPPADPNAPKPDEKKDEPKPEAFDLEKLELPEGITIPEDKREALTGIAQKHGLSNEAMKDLMALQADSLKTQAAAPYKLWQDTQVGWQNEIKADKEIGGDKLPATLQTVSKALDQYGTPGVRQALDYTGAGNNPEIVRTIHAMAKALGEGGHVNGNPPNGRQGPIDAASAIYPNLVQKG